MLELGCSTGRIAEPLAALGHRVTGVDSSAAMLAHLRRTEPVHCGIENLDLARPFDAVVLAGRLVNTHDPVQRAAFLTSARRHLSPGGTLVLQRYPPRYRPEPQTKQAGPVELELRDDGPVRRGRVGGGRPQVLTPDGRWLRASAT